VICPRGHAFDIARSGYINLLQPQDRRAAIPGDRPEAVVARRRFLDRGYAQPLLDGIRALIDGDAILDAGCGEGYYLGSIGHGCGVDISTAAIELASKRYPQCEWIVANADRFVPYADESFDTVMSITGRMNADEFHRVLKPEGSLVIAVASPDDLVELRGRGNRDRVERTIAMFASRFRFVDQQRISTRAQLDEQAASDIMTATYRVVRGLQPATVTLSLDVLKFVRAAT
jgi:23S rRNA (guanine745-N1)-methyltransferase